MLGVERELHKRGSAALAYLSHHAISDLYVVFSRDAELIRMVAAVNIAVQASNIAQRAHVGVNWRTTRLRDWVLILEYGSQDTSAAKQQYWAALLATSVIAIFEARCQPQHVDILHELENTEVLALDFLYTNSLGRTHLDHMSVATNNSAGVSPKILCKHVFMSADVCKQMLRHLYSIGLIKGISDGASMSMKQLYLTELGFALMGRLHFGLTHLVTSH